jgi:hypothetical protein
MGQAENRGRGGVHLMAGSEGENSFRSSQLDGAPDEEEPTEG